MPSANLSEVIDEWDFKFINSIELDNVFDLINAANYMDIPSLNKINSDIDYNNVWSFYIVVKNNNNFNIPISSTFSIDIKRDKNIDELGYCTEQNRNNNNEITLLCTP